MLTGGGPFGQALKISLTSSSLGPAAPLLGCGDAT